MCQGAEYCAKGVTGAEIVGVTTAGKGSKERSPLQFKPEGSSKSKPRRAVNRYPERSQISLQRVE